jgi:hypothetical protein
LTPAIHVDISANGAMDARIKSAHDKEKDGTLSMAPALCTRG